MSEPTGGIASLGINLNIFIAQLVNFLVVFLVLSKFAYKPLVKLLDERSKKIEESLKNADDVSERVKKLEGEQKEIISSARKEASLILESARAESEVRKQEMVLSAKQEVERVVMHGKEQLKAEKVQMVQEAKAELADLVVAATEKILKETVDEKSSRKMAEEVLKKLSV